MDFTAREDIEASVNHVFRHVTDFPSFERSIMRRGGDVERLTSQEVPGVGTAWQVRFRLRGKERTAQAEIVEFDAPHAITIKVTSPNVLGHMVVDLVALSKERTRLTVRVDATPKTLAAKLLFQSMRFGRQKVAGRFDGMVSNFAKDVAGTANT